MLQGRRIQRLATADVNIFVGEYILVGETF